MTRSAPKVLPLFARNALVSAACTLVLAGCAMAQDLSRELSVILNKARLGSAEVAVSVRDVESGRELAVSNGDRKMTPASNLKLLTSGAAVAVLGGDYEFRTEIRRHGNRLIVKGAGDPAFADPVLLEQMRVSLDTFVGRLVESITKVGMTRLDEIVVDDRVFDRDYVHPDWPREQLDKSYCAEISGLNFHANVLRIFASPASRDQELANITTEPSGAGIEINRRAKTVRGAGRSTAIGAVREPNENSFTINGTVSAALEVPAETTLHEPSLVFARMLAQKLAEAGVRPAAGDALATSHAISRADAAPCRLVGADEDLGAPDAVLAVVRTPLSVVLERCNRDSENFYAESLCKLIGNVATGQPGTWTSGTGVVRVQLRDRLGPEAASTVFLSDGSGMSRANKITASLMTGWLAALARDSAVANTFITSIPEAKVAGTMRRRFRDKTLTNEVRGKSGYINGVRTLSGYVTDPDSGRRVAYSVLVNDIPGNVTRAAVESVHEDVVLMADRWLSKQVEEPADRLGGGESKTRRK
jgi:D-alanyl-D-alanine carboxypeptidase/D-alanyl-D-alanine-endopeptidase (penicillin-binding protein 4)